MTRSQAFRRLLNTPLVEWVARGRARQIARDLKWGEGPAWLPDRDLWLWSDIPNDRMLCWNERDGLQDFRRPSFFSNGNSVARDGSLLTCEHGARRVSRTDRQGHYSVICDSFDGGRLNSPNDIVEALNGRIWFTDPTYGIISDVEGYRAPSEQARNRVYSVDPGSGEVRAQIETLSMPNGLCFTPDGRRIYVSDTGADMGPEVPFDPAGPRHVFAFDLDDRGDAIDNGQLFMTAGTGVPDGLRCDEEGFLWVSTGRGLECFAPDGTLEGVLETPEILSNLSFGGEDGHMMLLALSNSAYLLSAREDRPA